MNGLILLSAKGIAYGLVESILFSNDAFWYSRTASLQAIMQSLLLRLNLHEAYKWLTHYTTSLFLLIASSRNAYNLLDILQIWTIAKHPNFGSLAWKP